jgi:hypothetical protein
VTDTFDRKKAGLNATAYSYVTAALLTAPRSKAELEEISGMGNSLSSRVLKALRDRGVLYVSGWRLDARGRATIREFRLGVNGKDVPCPKVPRAEVVRKYMANKRKAKQGETR